MTSMSYNLGFSFSIFKNLDRFAFQVHKIVEMLCSSVNITDVHYIT